MTRKNIQLATLIHELKKAASENNVALWKRIANDLEKPTRNTRIVNLSKLEKFSNEGEMIIVPGKVLGSGELTKKMTVAAFKFSDSAKEKIVSAKGSTLDIFEMLKKNPKGQKIRIIG